MKQQFIAGVDLGATNVRVVIAQPSGEIEARRALPGRGLTPERALSSIGRTIDELLRGIWSSATVGAIGMALPGTVDPARGLVSSAANLPDWGDVDLAAMLGESRGVPVAVENDANAAAVGEGWLGAAQGMSDFAFVALGTGIGVGLWLGGKLQRGAHFLAGEAAFIRVTPEQLRAGGWQQNLEGTAAGRAWEVAAQEILGANATPQRLFEAASDGHEAARAWLSRTHEYLAMAIIDIVALVDPQAVIVGGGLALAHGESLLAPVRELAHRCTPLKTPILASSLGADAQVLGAVKIAVDAMERRD